MPNPGYPTPSNQFLGWPNGPWGSPPKSNAFHGHSGGRVLYINAHMYYLSGQSTNPQSSYFSYATLGAVRNYQEFWGLTVDGWVGPQTGAVMDWHTTL